MKGPGIFLAQFMSDDAPLNQFDTACKWAADLDYAGVQVPSWDARCIDLQKASESKDYCQELAGVAKENGVEISELSTHLQGQLVAVHPAYTSMFQVFAPADVNTPEAMHEYGSQQVKWCLKASEHLGLKLRPAAPAVGNPTRLDASIAGALKTVGVAPVADDQPKLAGVVRGRSGIDERLEVGSRPADQDGKRRPQDTTTRSPSVDTT